MSHPTDQNSVVIVSGLPRSGTSLLMQMLAAGGLPLLTDGVRQADDDNHRGYYELEAVKKTKTHSWLADAPGKAVKMVYLLLYTLPPGYQYRVVFLQRKLEEVLASQKIMLQRQGKPTGADDATLLRIFQKELAKIDQWLRAQPNFSLLDVNYNQLVLHPQLHAEQINEFLGGELNIAAMAAAVDPAQYRNRK